MPASKLLPNLSFKDFMTYAELESFLKALAAARPGLTKLHSLGPSREGRQVYCLTITDLSTRAPEDKPAYLIHGNIHASELSGTHAALYTARQLLADHPKQRGLLQEAVFHIVPRLNPDGAERVATAAESVRSRMDRSVLVPNTLYQSDIDGNGLLLDMIWAHPDGNLVKDPKDPRLLVTRKKDSRPPCYRRAPEGKIHMWDGSENFAVEGRWIDWNRQWSYDWRPEPEQGGAGDFPYSEPEMRHIASFIHARSTLFGILGYHNGPAGVLRPPSTGTDDSLDNGDLRKMDALAKIGSKLTGFPVIPIYKYHDASSRHINLYGHFPSTGYLHFGLFVIEIELGMIYDSAGVGSMEIFANETPEQFEAQMRKVLKWWDKRRKSVPLYHPWKKFKHPQLGPVEIGGFNRKYLSGPLLSDLKKTCAKTYQFTLEHAAKRPRVMIEDVSAQEVGDGIYRVRARVANRGEFPTNITNRGKQLARLKTVRVEFETGSGVKVLSQKAHHDLGHLNGLSDSRPLEWFVSAKKGSTCTLRVLGGTGGNQKATVPLR